MTSEGDRVWVKRKLQRSEAAHRKPIEERGANAWPGAEDTQLGILHHTHPHPQNYFVIFAQKLLCLSRYMQDVISDIWKERWPYSRGYVTADRSKAQVA